MLTWLVCRLAVDSIACLDGSHRYPQMVARLRLSRKRLRSPSFLFASFIDRASLFHLNNIHFTARKFVMDRHSLANLWFSTILGLAIEPQICSAICSSVIDYDPRGPGIYLNDCTGNLVILRQLPVAEYEFRRFCAFGYMFCFT